MEDFSYWVKVRVESALDPRSKPERREEYRLAGEKLIELMKKDDDEE